MHVERRLRWFQVSLRTLLMVMTLCALATYVLQDDIRSLWHDDRRDMDFEVFRPTIGGGMRSRMSLKDAQAERENKTQPRQPSSETR